MAKVNKVVCRCGKGFRSMKDWNKHLTKKHPTWVTELEGPDYVVGKVRNTRG